MGLLFEEELKKPAENRISFQKLAKGEENVGEKEGSKL